MLDIRSLQVHPDFSSIRVHDESAMAPVVLDVYDSDDPQSVIRKAITHLTNGEIVAFPTETVYGIAVRAGDSHAIERLFRAKSRSTDKPMTLAIGIRERIEQFSHQQGPWMQRLARRCWPGPLTMVVKTSANQGNLTRETLQWIAPQGWLGLRVPSNEVLLAVLDQMDEPLVLTSANQSDQPDATTASQVAEQLDESVPLILDGGPAKIGTPSTVIQLHDDHIQVLRWGVIDQPSLQQFLQLEIVLECTGNTCRSPMAEALLKQKLAQHHSLTQPELADRGIHISSAGISAGFGSPAATSAIDVLEHQNLDLRGHLSQPLSYSKALSADLILTLTKSHHDAIVNQWPEFADKTKTLATDRCDVSDPIGGSFNVYEQCANQIEDLLEKRLPEIHNLAIPQQDFIRE